MHHLVGARSHSTSILDALQVRSILRSTARARGLFHFIFRKTAVAPVSWRDRSLQKMYYFTFLLISSEFQMWSS